jgi:hypothetical protein
MGSEDHFADSRELLDFGSRTITLRDRLLAGTLPEEGGGAPGLSLPSDPVTRASVAAVQTLPTGRDTRTDLASSDLGLRIEAWVRGVVPVIAGGA